MLTYQRAFPGDLSSGIVHKILSGNPEPLETLIPDLDAAVIAVVAKCLEKDPDRRYPDLGATRRDLAGVRNRIATEDLSDFGPTLSMPVPRADTPRAGDDAVASQTERHQPPGAAPPSRRTDRAALQGSERRVRQRRFQRLPPRVPAGPRARSRESAGARARGEGAGCARGAAPQRLAEGSQRRARSRRADRGIAAGRSRPLAEWIVAGGVEGPRGGGRGPEGTRGRTGARAPAGRGGRERASESRERRPRRGVGGRVGGPRPRSIERRLRSR